MAELAKHDLVTLPAAGAGLRVDPALRALRTTARFQVDDLFSIVDLAESGAGIAPLPEYLARRSVERAALVRVLPRTEIARYPVQAVVPSNRHLPMRVRVVIEALSERSSRA